MEVVVVVVVVVVVIAVVIKIPGYTGSRSRIRSRSSSSSSSSISRRSASNSDVNVQLEPGATAAEDRDALVGNQVRGKWCSAGTVGVNKYEIVYFQEVREFEPFPSNKFGDPAWKDDAVQATKAFFGFWTRKRRVLVYCRQGANRSAQQVVLLMAVAARCTAREAPNRVDMRFSRTFHLTRVLPSWF